MSKVLSEEDIGLAGGRLIELSEPWAMKAQTISVVMTVQASHEALRAELAQARADLDETMDELTRACVDEEYSPVQGPLEILTVLKDAADQAHEDAEELAAKCNKIEDERDALAEQVKDRQERIAERDHWSHRALTAEENLAAALARVDTLQENERGLIAANQCISSEKAALAAKLALAEAALRGVRVNLWGSLDDEWVVEHNAVIDDYFASTANESTTQEATMPPAGESPAEATEFKLARPSARDGTNADCFGGTATAGSQGNPLASAAASSPTPQGSEQGRKKCGHWYVRDDICADCGVNVIAEACGVTDAQPAGEAECIDGCVPFCSDECKCHCHVDFKKRCAQAGEGEPRG